MAFPLTGVEFYAVIAPPRGLSSGYLALLDAVDSFAAPGKFTPEQRTRRLAQAARTRRLFNKVWKEYELLGAESSVMATRMVRQHIKATAVRPPTSGRMADAIQSRPIPTTFPGAALGIGHLPTLDKGATRPGYESDGPYWRTQEYGYAGHVGRKVPGYFMSSPGGTGVRPDDGQFRVHPYFESAGRGANGKAPKGTPAMIIRKPIIARHFLRDGTQDLLAWRRLEFARINRNAIAVMAAI